jgi:hypothetical protein
MTRLIDFVLDIWERIMRFFGLDRITRRGREMAQFEGRSSIGRIWGLLRPAIVLVMIAWFGACIWRFSYVRDFDMAYPQAAMSDLAQPIAAGRQIEVGGGDSTKTCAPSRIVENQIALIDQIVNRNDWTAASPMFKLGFFGVIDFEDTPFFDNKMSFQLGVLDAMRLMAIQLEDSLGRVRGTSSADTNLQGAQSRLRINERAWVFNNPFDKQLGTFQTSAAGSYRGAIVLYENYNTRLVACDALFDARADNLFALLSRISADIGSISERLAQRARGEEWDVEAHAFVATTGDGNDRGWFDMRADNLFHVSRGRMYALHGLLQGAKADFSDVIANRDLAGVWARMEAHIAEAALLDPQVVSNGRADGTLAPDHLSVMAAYVLRARANMVELRSILNR